jgi:cell wall-associated NlpC family hydrolase
MAQARFRMPAFAASLAAATVLALAPVAHADKLGGVTLPPSIASDVTGPAIVKDADGPTVKGRRALVIGDKAYAPSKAPSAVKRVIWAANKIRHKPYVWGGGHAHYWKDRGYDCSGSVSYALHGGGLVDYPMASGSLARWGHRGDGKWITIYANATHVFMVVAGLRFDTSGYGESGPRWRLEPRSTHGFHHRHPSGL